MTELYVDTDAMRQLVRSLNGIHDSLQDAAGNLEAGAIATGSEAVYSALVSFGKGWQDGRKTITNEVAELAQAARGSAQAYADAESRITSSARLGNFPPSSRRGPA